MKRVISYLIFILLVRCTSDESVNLSQEAYFPLSVGAYHVYDVVEIRYSAFNPPESLSYQLKDEIVDTFTNGEGVTTFVIHRSTRESQNDTWAYLESLSAYKSSQYAIVKEGNVSFVRLQFPLRTKSIWNGNLFNNLPEDVYTVESLGKSFTVSPNNTFENCVRVIQNDERSLLAVDERIEVYAWNKGLVYKESNVVQYNTSGGLPGSQIIGGYYLKQVLKENGEN